MRSSRWDSKGNALVCIEYGLWPNMIGRGHIQGRRPGYVENGPWPKILVKGLSPFGATLYTAVGRGFVRQRRWLS